MNFRPMILRVRVGLDCIDVDLSAERLVGRLLQTSNDHSGPGKGDNPPHRGNESDPPKSVVRLAAPAELKRTGKEMKFIVERVTNVRTADPSLARLIVRADRLMRRLAENPGSTLEDIASRENMGGPYAARLIRTEPSGPGYRLSDSRRQTARQSHRQQADSRHPLAA